MVRTLINAFGFNNNSLLLDSFNGSGTATHEASLMGIKSTGIDVTPMGNILSELKNTLLFIEEKALEFTTSELQDILEAIENKRWDYKGSTINKLMLEVYFDTIDAFERTSRYNKKGKIGLFIEKFNYIKNCYSKTMDIKNTHNLIFEPANIIESDII